MILYILKIHRLKEIQNTKSILIYSNCTDKSSLERLNLNNDALSLYDKLGGDGTVPYSSLTLPLNYWKNVESIKMHNTGHTTILQDKKFLDLCKDIIRDN